MLMLLPWYVSHSPCSVSGPEADEGSSFNSRVAPLLQTIPNRSIWIPTIIMSYGIGLLTLMGNPMASVSI
jgi:hypothetical protein